MNLLRHVVPLYGMLCTLESCRVLLMFSVFRLWARRSTTTSNIRRRDPDVLQMLQSLLDLLHQHWTENRRIRANRERVPEIGTGFFPGWTSSYFLLCRRQQVDGSVTILDRGDRGNIKSRRQVHRGSVYSTTQTTPKQKKLSNQHDLNNQFSLLRFTLFPPSGVFWPL